MKKKGVIIGVIIAVIVIIAISIIGSYNGLISKGICGTRNRSVYCRF